MDKKDVQGIFEEVRANRIKLDGCAGPHEFVVDNPEEKPWRQKYRCTLCGGTLERHLYFWYKRGLEHGLIEGRKAK